MTGHYNLARVPIIVAVLVNKPGHYHRDDDLLNRLFLVDRVAIVNRSGLIFDL